jgi:type IV pilus assembly protein PilQ
MAATAAAIIVQPAASNAAVWSDSTRAAQVTAISVVATSGRAEVVIGFDGAADVQDFVLSSPRRIVVDVSPATLGFTPRLYDRVARGGIVNIRVAQFKPDVVRIVLDAEGEAPYEIVRGGDDVRLRMAAAAEFAPWHVGAARPATEPDVAPVVIAPVANSPRVTPLPALQVAQERITVSFRDMPLRDVVATFAAVSGRTIIPGGSTVMNTTNITLEVNNQPWDVALNGILAAYGMAAIEDPVSRIITIDTYSNLQARRASERLVQERISLNYAKAAELAVTLRALLYRECGGALEVVGGASAGAAGAAGAAAGGAANGAAGAAPPAQQLQQAPTPTTCNPRGNVVEEIPSNSLIVTESESRMESLLAYARSFDFRPPQVNISAKIIAVNRTTTEQLGVQYDFGTRTTFFNTILPRVSATGQSSEAQVTLGGDAFAGVANASMTFTNPSALNLIYTSAIGGFTLTSLLEALSQEQLSDIQSQPSVNTLDKRQASIFVGNDIAFLLTPQAAPGAVQTAPPQIDIIQAGINLVVTPSISANRMVRLTVEVEQAALVDITVAGPNIARRTVANEVLVRDGETLVIGGLTQVETSDIRRGIPFLSKLPLIGRVFSSNESIERKNDLLVLITPHILDDPDPRPPGGE